jgi:hypothetical protein
MKAIHLIFLVTLISFSGYSQSYFTSAGARFGTDWGITVQQKVLKHATVEGIFQSSLFREELMLTGLFEYHFPVITKRLNIYAGAGFHQGFNTQLDPTYESPYGITAIAGAEFTIARFTISYDYKPAFNLYGGENSWYNQSALSVRYVIVPQHVFAKMKRERERKDRREDRREKLMNVFPNNR